MASNSKRKRYRLLKVGERIKKDDQVKIGPYWVPTCYTAKDCIHVSGETVGRYRRLIKTN